MVIRKAERENIKRIEQRYVWQDHCKGLAILLVVLGHLLDHEDLYHGETIVSYVIYGFHMPLFFVLSGYTLKISMERGIFEFPQYAWKYIKRILFPGILFTCVEFVIDSIRAAVAGRDNLIGYWGYFKHGDLLYHTLAMDSRSIIPQYWFFPALFSALILMWWILYVTKIILKNIKIDVKQYHFLEIIFQICILVLLVVMNVTLKEKHFVMPLCMREALMGAVYVWIGYQLKKIEFGSISIYTKVISVVLCGAVYTIGTAVWYGRGYDLLDFYNSGVDNMPLSYLLGISGSVFVIVVYRIIDGNTRENTRMSPLIYAGKNSMWVYGLHFFYLEFWYWLNNYLPNYRSLVSVWVKLAVTVAIMAASLITAQLIIKLYEIKINQKRN